MVVLKPSRWDEAFRGGPVRGPEVPFPESPSARNQIPGSLAKLRELQPHSLEFGTVNFRESHISQNVDKQEYIFKYVRLYRKVHRNTKNINIQPIFSKFSKNIFSPNYKFKKSAFYDDSYCNINIVAGHTF